MTTGQTIDYEALQQDAMRGVVRAVLNQIVKTGLPGEHHFYISFLTQAPGVILSKRLKEKYPQEMTIVLQHRFWDLLVSEDRFEVKLTFDGVPERLVVPYRSVKVFIDPSVRFGLQFEEAGTSNDAPAPRHDMTMDAAFDAAGEAHADGPRAPSRTKSKTPRKPRSIKDISLPEPAQQPLAPVPQPASAAAPVQEDVKISQPDKGVTDTAGAKILSLDQFRKK